MLESFYSARQQYQEEEAREASLNARRTLKETAMDEDNATSIDGSLNYYPLDSLLEDLVKSCDTGYAVRLTLEAVFAWYL